MNRISLAGGALLVLLSGCGGDGGSSSSGSSGGSLEVSSIAPSDGATGVATDTVLTATLSQDVDCGALPTNPLVLSDAADNTVSGSVGCSGTTVTFTPDSSLANSTTYTATLNSGISTAAGATLDAASTWSFTTVADTTPPTVSSVSPTDGATGSARTTTVTATFDEALDCSTVTTSSFTLSGVSGSVDCSGTGVTFTPAADLAYGTTYTATLTTAVSDAAGNPLAAAYSWSFTTVADSEAPAVAITSHADGDTFTATHTVTLSGTASDNVAVTSLTVSVNGGAATALSLSGGSYSTDLTFTSDSNEVVVTATDAVGNSSSATVNLYYVATGLLDTSFDSVGYYTFPDVAGSHESIAGLVIADDGSYYMTGYVRNATGTGYDIGVWHLLADGTPDTGFDGDGLALLAGPAGGTSHDFGTGLALDGDGKVVVVGHSINASGNDDLVVARFNTDGSLDTTFGGDVNPADSTPDGFTVVNVSGTSADSGSGIVIDSSGGIYVSGTTDAAGDNDFTVWKFTSAGALDTSFAGGAGYLSYDSGGADQANAITMDAEGRLLVAGSASGVMAIWRLTAAGVTDTSFNGTGVAAFTSGTGYAITTDANGSIVVAGTMAIVGENYNMALWRYTSSGAIDTSFGGDYDSDLTPDGYVYHDGAGYLQYHDIDNGYAVAIDAAGNLLVAGSSIANHSGAYKTDMVVWRFTADGVLDTTFGDDITDNTTYDPADPPDGIPDGFFTHNGAAGGNNVDTGKAIAIDSLGRIVVAGESSNALNNTDGAVWRLY